MTTTTDRKIRRMPVRAVRVELPCDTNGCDGMMEFDGYSFTALHADHMHTCTKCHRRIKVQDEKFPHIEHIDDPWAAIG